MAENAPPAGAGSAGTDASRGMPHYERLRRDLREALQKKRQIDAALAAIEDNIYRHETGYLEETTAGNIIKGFDNYIKGATTTSTAGGAGTATRRKAPISDVDRIFSRSSASFLRDPSASTPGSTQTTPSHAPTPTSSFPTRENSQPTSNGANRAAMANKKKRATDDEDTDGKPSKRGKITYGRE
ncbi:histone acetyltransferase subunit NuA4-domain-containing protein [Lophiotrema nucula]|uniref:Chromatin modification-related protein EAF6 n=1 Tax=Lophiotrema nucula TaxID=690887 RepID=A0A6A5ZFV1_9PLEO|nr:histone acetyltransferase subunit NuA4-domain-containing protein [Lophiotrema nucula]